MQNDKPEMTNEELQLMLDYVTLFTSEVGKRVLEDLEKFCHFLRPTFDPNSPRRTDNLEGRREVVCRIHRMIRDTVDSTPLR